MKPAGAISVPRLVPPTRQPADRTEAASLAHAVTILSACLVLPPPTAEGVQSHIVGQMATALALIEGPDCSPEIILQQLALDAESGSEE